MTTSFLLSAVLSATRTQYVASFCRACCPQAWLIAMGGSASKDSTSADCPVINQDNTSSCPVPESQRNSVAYNVYNQRIDSVNAASTSNQQGSVDPRNNMPREPNQQPCAGQRQLISTSRLISNIPKGGTQGTWVYPSPQMFYNGKQLYRLQLHLCKPA